MNAIVVSMVIPAALAVVMGSLGLWTWRRRRRVIAVVTTTAAVCAALVAIRDLPEPVVVGLLLSGLGAVAAVTAWPLLAARRSGSRTEAER